MPEKENEAMVLRAQPLGESDRIVTFLTRASGKIRGVAKGARRSRRRFGSNLELLSRVRLRTFEREGQDLARVESADLLESFYDLQADPERGAVLACLAEVSDAFAREQQEDEAFFRLLLAVLRAVRAGTALDWAHRYFEIWTLRLHGVLPDLDACGRCRKKLLPRGGWFRQRDSAVLCSDCRGAPGGLALPADALKAAAEILRRPPEAFAGVPPVDPALQPLAALAQASFAEAVERRLRSYEVLAQVRRPR